MENFHSIIHRGLSSSLNERSKFGPGTYLTLNFNTANSYASKSFPWEHSQFIPKTNSKPKVKCIAVVEVVDDPSISWPQVKESDVTPTEDLWFWRRKSYCCVVNSDDLMQLSHLIVLFFNN